MKGRFSVALGLVVTCAAVVGGASGSPPVAPGPPATATGLAVQIVAADQTLAGATSQASAPPDAAPPQTSFAYPADGSVAAAASTSVNTTASAEDGTASVTTSLSGISLFQGEITADAVQGSVSSAGTVGDLGDSALTNLVVLGAPVTATPNARIPLADWGYALLLAESTKTGGAASPSWRGTVTALVVHLDADHGGLTAGSEIRIGYADAYARPPAPPATTAATTTTKTTTTAKPSRAAHRPRGAQMPPPSFAPGTDAKTKSAQKAKRGGPLVLTPPTVTPKLTSGGYVFPVYGPSGYGDTFGAPRGDVSGGWHHGDDIFAPLGAPILAVPSGTVFSVGWNDDRRLAALAAGQRRERVLLRPPFRLHEPRGERSSRDTPARCSASSATPATPQGTPFHLHFEVHPVSMLFLGYDGAVNPTQVPRRLEAARGHPDPPGRAVLATQPQAGAASSAPAPGAILLESSDISTASGLDPGSLRRAMRAPVAVESRGSSIGQLPTPLPVLDRA